MKYFKFPLALVLALVVLSCGNKKKQEVEQAVKAFDIEDYIKTAESIEPNLSKVDQVFSILDMVNAEYYESLTNDPYSAHSYKTSYPVAAANLGIYITDIVYHQFGGQEEKMYLTFQAAQELANYVGVESAFSSWTIDNIEGADMMKRDTLTMLFNTLLKDSEKYNSEKEMVFVHTAFLTGSFIEKVFISGNLLKQKMQESELTQEQEGDIKKLLVIYLNQLDPATGTLYKAFEQQKEALSGLTVLSTFEKLEALSVHLREIKPDMIAAPVAELASNKDLITSFELITDLRNVLVSATQ